MDTYAELKRLKAEVERLDTLTRELLLHVAKLSRLAATPYSPSEASEGASADTAEPDALDEAYDEVYNGVDLEEWDPTLADFIGEDELDEPNVENTLIEGAALDDEIKRGALNEGTPTPGPIRGTLLSSDVTPPAFKDEGSQHGDAFGGGAYGGEEESK